MHIFQGAFDELMRQIPDMSSIDDELKVNYMCYKMKQNRKQNEQG